MNRWFSSVALACASALVGFLLTRSVIEERPPSSALPERGELVDREAEGPALLGAAERAAPQAPERPRHLDAESKAAAEWSASDLEWASSTSAWLARPHSGADARYIEALAKTCDEEPTAWQSGVALRLALSAASADQGALAQLWLAARGPEARHAIGIALCMRVARVSGAQASLDEALAVVGNSRMAELLTGLPGLKWTPALLVRLLTAPDAAAHIAEVATRGPELPGLREEQVVQVLPACVEAVAMGDRAVPVLTLLDELVTRSGGVSTQLRLLRHFEESLFAGPGRGLDAARAAAVQVPRLGERFPRLR